jgi:hypothetical protein
MERRGNLNYNENVNVIEIDYLPRAWMWLFDQEHECDREREWDREYSRELD